MQGDKEFKKFKELKIINLQTPKPTLKDKQDLKASQVHSDTSSPVKNEKPANPNEENLDDFIKRVKSDIGMPQASKLSKVTSKSMPTLLDTRQLSMTTYKRDAESEEGLTRTQELNENNFIKKMKALSKTHVDVTVKALRAPKLKTDIYSVDPLRILAKTNNSGIPATRQERTNQLNFTKSRSDFPNTKKWFQEEQIKNPKFEQERKEWNKDLIQGKISGINELMHQTGLMPARVNTLKFHDITSGIANLQEGRNFKRIAKSHGHDDFKKNLDKFQADQQDPTAEEPIPHKELMTTGFRQKKEEWGQVDWRQGEDKTRPRTQQHPKFLNSLSNPSTYAQLIYNIPNDKFVDYVGVDKSGKDIFGTDYQNLTYTKDIDEKERRYLETCSNMYETLKKSDQKNETDYNKFIGKVNNKTMNNKNFTKNQQKPKPIQDANLRDDHYVEPQSPQSINYLKQLNNCFGSDDGVRKRGFTSQYQFKPQYINIKQKDIDDFKNKNLM